MSAKLGESLLKDNLITPQQLKEALDYQRVNGGRLASTLVKLCMLSDEEVTAVLSRHGIEYALQWTLGGLPFLTTPGVLVGAAQEVIRAETGIETELSTTGGTSDGRFIAQVCPEVLELGPPNASIHKIDEHVDIAELETLKNIYRRLLSQLAKISETGQ